MFGAQLRPAVHQQSKVNSIIIIIMKRVKSKGLQEHFTKVRIKACIRSRAQAKTRQTQSWPKHRRKSSDLRRRLKAVNDVDEV